MKKQALAVLLGYLRNQKTEIDRLVAEIRKTEPVNTEKTVYLGYLLHNLYSAFEDLFKEVAKTFENQIEDPTKYHQELLKRMLLEIPLIRPQLLSKGSYIILDELRRFRHTFRHAYTYDLDMEKVDDVKQRFFIEYDKIISDIQRFHDYLQGKIHE